MKNFLEKLKFALFTPRLKCICCGAEIINAPLHSLCENCYESLPKIDKPCLKCGSQLPQAGQYCVRCKSANMHFEKCISVFVYDGAVRGLIYKLKYSGDKFLARPLGFLLAEKFKQAGLIADVAVCVPLCDKRAKTRGYNQSELLMQQFCVHSGMAASTGNLVRTKDTASQTEKNYAARQENLKNAFKVLNPQEFAGKTVLLIDDVITTGATLNECAQVLIKAKPAKIYCLTVANTERKLQFEQKHKEVL